MARSSLEMNTARAAEAESARKTGEWQNENQAGLIFSMIEAGSADGHG
jgi:hypothetical protein